MARALLIAVFLFGCSALDDRLSVARCTSDVECAALDDPDQACVVHVCDAVSQRCVPSAPDLDGDGHSATACGGGDCDDADPRVHPDATEVCNGVDDNCNGLLDGPDEDDDGDGHADACAGAAATDCDDESPATYQGAPELCDRIDNDCIIDGAVRFGGGEQPEPSEDADEDGRAPNGANCEGGPLLPGDCDDTSAAVYDGAPERCDGLDNDCDGTPDDASHIEGVDPTERGAICHPVALAASTHTCAILRDERVVCWGDRGGALGEERRIDANDPTSALLTNLALEVEALGPVSQITAGNGFTCVRDAEDRVVCWGRDLAHGIERNNDPRNVERFGRVTVPGVPPAIDLDAGGEVVCAVSAEGEVYCWGAPHYGTLGPGRSGSLGEVRPAGRVEGVAGAVQVSVSTSVACARTGEGRVYCWGYNDEGALGVSDRSARFAEVSGIDDAIDVAAGGGELVSGFACAVRSDQTVWCWGRNQSGEIGCGDCSTGTHFTPRQVQGVSGAIRVRAGDEHACAITAAGELFCWGSNREGQLGYSSTAGGVQRSAIRASFEGALDLTLGTEHTCAVGLAESRCWGEGASRQLGDGRLSDLPDYGYTWSLPRRISVLAHPLEIAAHDRWSCFRLPNDDVRCVGETYTFGPQPTDTIGRLVWSDVADLAAAGRGLCAALRDGTVRCDEDYNSQAIDEGYEALTDVVQLAVGWRDGGVGVSGDGHACALHGDGTVDCWGDHGNGQLGAGSLPFVAGDVHPASRVVGLSDAVQIAAGQAHTCALRASGAIECWGANAIGQLGSRPLIDSNVPRPVEGLPRELRVRSVIAGLDTTCALFVGGELWCWGAGLGGGPSGPSPTRVEGLGIVEEAVISNPAEVGRQATACARLTTGQVRCWGANDYRQLGGNDLSSNPSRVPVDVIGLSDAVALGAGGTHFCAVRSSGQAVCWGNGANSRTGASIGGTLSLPSGVQSLLGI